MSKIRKSLPSTLVLTVISGALLLLTPGATQLKAAENEQNPVLLVHGLASRITSWENLPRYLGDQGFDVYTLNFNAWSWLPYAQRQHSGFNELAAVLSRKITEIKELTGRKKVDIIAHCMGGIVVRGYIAGWGERVEKQARYKDDIGRIIYIATPHYGLNIDDAKLKKLLQETEYGDFLSDPSAIVEALHTGSSELMELHDFFRANGSKLGIEELTISSEADIVVKEYHANLDGIGLDPLAPAAVDDSRHIFLLNYRHAYSPLLGNSNKTILGVDRASHPLLGISSEFLKGKSGWQRYQRVVKKEETLMFLRFPQGGGINLQELNANKVSLKKVMGGGKDKNVKLQYNPGSGVFYTTGLQSGKFKLIVPYKKDANHSFRFLLDIAGGAVTVVEFEANNPPPDPDLIELPGGAQVYPEDLPRIVKSFNTLRNFVLASYKKEARVWKSGSEISMLTRHVRDAVIDLYPTKLPFEKDNPDAEIDKFRLKGGRVIDFVAGSTEPGIFLNKLQWLPIKEGGPDPEAFPEMVDNLETLTKFAEILYGEKLDQNQSELTLRKICKKLRDTIIEQYPETYKLAYPSSPSEARDILCRKDDGMWVDFFINYENGDPIPRRHLCWQVREPDPEDGGGGGGGGDYPSSPPSDVYNYDTVRHFILWYLRDECYAWQSPDMKAICRRVRDKLAAMYTNIERLNDQKERFGYTAPDSSHSDAIYLVNQNIVIDFCTASSSGGKLINKIGWGQVGTPW